MAEIHFRNENYLLDQAKRYRASSKYSLWAAFGVIMAGAILSYWVINSDLRFAYQISLFSIVAFVSLAYIYTLLYDYSQHELLSIKYHFGFTGEARVYHELASLPDSYAIYCDARIDRYGNIDFVVQRGSIFFNIEVKNHAGRISYNGARLLKNGRLFPNKDPLGQTLDNGSKLKKALERNFGPGNQVVSVLVFSNPKSWVDIPLNPGNVVCVLHLRGLLKFIRSFE